ncbi:MAG TPA: TrmH family RNA methyltransferase [Thermoanaerobaculia bacterium]|jgi:TrmH family RNA methyltransferase
MPNLRVVLVEPKEAGNVGAAARVMKNFGFESLTIAGEHPELQPLSSWWASGAGDVVERATFTPSLFDAIRDAHVTIATTSLRGRTTPADMTPFDVADLFASLRDDQTLSLVFGREDSGLTREEVMACQRTAVIPTNPEFPTMNLAQAVGAFCFALSQIPLPPGEGGRRPGEGRASRQVRRERDLAPAAIIERLHERVQALLVEVGFLRGDDNPDRIYDDLRTIAARADIDAREATILLGIIHQIEWKLGAPRERP